MARSQRKQLIACLLVLCAALIPTPSLADDAGLVLSAEASHKFSKQLTAGFEVEFRSRNNFRTADRVSLGPSVTYKLLPWLKASVEFHTTRDLEKTRFIVGVEHTIKKTHAFKAYYRYQLTGNGSDEPNIHMLGLGYTYKF